MPVFRSPWEQSQNVLSMMIPLIMRKKQDQAELALKQQDLDLRKKALEEEAVERGLKQKEALFNIKVKSLQDLHNSAYEKSDKELVESTGTQLNQLGFPIAGAVQPSDELDMTGAPNIKWLVKPEKQELTGEAKNLEILLGRKPTVGEVREFKEKETGAKADILNLNGIAYQVRTDESGNKSLIQIGGDEKPKTKEQLTMATLSGDAEAKQLLEKISAKEVDMAYQKGKAGAEGKLAGLESSMDIDGTANAIIDGRETIENVKNTFGVPIQERVRKKVLEKDPKFNFNQPRAVASSLKSSLQQQQKNRGMMGSFVKNINGQVNRLEQISSDIVKRVGVRAFDLPLREFKTRFVGSGNERVMEAYMKEVSAEIAKLSQGSAASIAQLPEENRREWEKIHDVNLSMRELLIILKGTREMANIRLQSVDDEIDETMGKLGNVRGGRIARDEKQGKPVNELTDQELLEFLNAD